MTNRSPWLSILRAATACGGCLTWAAPSRCAEAPEVRWEQIGPGGGGRILAEGISPSAPDRMILTNDMGGAFRSVDAGRTWERVEHPGIPRSWSPGSAWFHPRRPGLVFYGRYRGFYRSRDDGATWEPVPGPWDEVEETGPNTASRGPALMAFDAAAGEAGIMVYSRYRRRDGVQAFVSGDAGETWRPAAPFPEGAGSPVGAAVDGESGTFLVAFPGAILRSGDGGASWSPCAIGSDAPVAGLAGGASAAGSRVYAVLERRTGEGTIGSGLRVTVDGGHTWREPAGEGLVADEETGELQQWQGIAVCATDPMVAVGITKPLAGKRLRRTPDDPGHPSVLRTDDGGASWRPILFRHPGMARYNLTTTTWLTDKWGSLATLASVAICPSDPDILVATDWTRAFRTEDGGRTWREMQSPALPAPDAPTPGGGIPVLNVNRYVVHPTDPNFHVAPAMDFWGFVSADGGRTWVQPSLPLIGANLYAVLCDPEVPGRIWAGGSAAHDVPLKGNYAEFGRKWGGLVRSEDRGESWAWSSWDEGVTGLPKGLVSGLAGDWDSPAGNRRLWAAVFGQGIFETRDHGQSWTDRTPRNEGGTRDFWGLVRTDDGRFLFTLDRAGDGALWRSGDGGEAWERLNSVPLRDAWGWAVHPTDPQILFVARCGALFDPANPRGLWRTRDGGGSWENVLPADCADVTFDPANPAVVYAAGYNNGAIHLSRDGGDTWVRLHFPFWRPKSVTCDPRDPRVVFVTTSGCSIFRGTFTGNGAP